MKAERIFSTGFSVSLFFSYPLIYKIHVPLIREPMNIVNAGTYRSIVTNERVNTKATSKKSGTNHLNPYFFFQMVKARTPMNPKCNNKFPSRHKGKYYNSIQLYIQKLS